MYFKRFRKWCSRFTKIKYINSGKLVNPRIKGTVTMNGNIIPKHTEQYDLGSDEINLGYI